ncbi:fatty acid desaturase 2 [Rhodotorula toruloides]|uniref:Fatty acid desaturase 2 n=1 Tax=Rhodotorula toruloides TaxID=5286 RepID=A0A511K8P0_RHOTO|nr:fatty acid desaturase 2 [Rhodotorula toruloides]
MSKTPHIRFISKGADEHVAALRSRAGVGQSAERFIVQVITAEEVAKHNTADSAWVIIEGGVYDVTDFLEDHPGGKKVLLKACGQDSTEKFWNFHSKKVLEKTAKPFLIGKVGEASKL